MVFQNYALYPHMTVGENIGFALKLAKVPKDEIERAGRRGGRDPRARGAPRPQARPALRRPAPARGDGAGDRARAGGVPARRAAVEPRRQAARPDARRDRPPPASPRRHHHLRDPRPGRGDDARRPGRRDERGVLQQVGRAPGALRRAGQPLRRRVHRLAGDEPLRGRPDPQTTARTRSRLGDQSLEVDPSTGRRPPAARGLRRPADRARGPTRGHRGRLGRARASGRSAVAGPPSSSRRSGQRSSSMPPSTPRRSSPTT